MTENEEIEASIEEAAKRKKKRSAVKRALDSKETIVRMFNPFETTRRVALQGTEVTMNEEEIGAFSGEIKPNQIVSVKIR